MDTLETPHFPVRVVAMRRTERKKGGIHGFAERMRTMRIQRGFSQAELGKLVDIHQNQIGRYELGSAQPNADSIVKLAAVFDVSTDFLLNGASEDALRARLEDRDFLEMFRRAEKLPEDDKIVIKKFLRAFLNQKQIEELTAAG